MDAQVELYLPDDEYPSLVALEVNTVTELQNEAYALAKQHGAVHVSFGRAIERDENNLPAYEGDRPKRK